MSRCDCCNKILSGFEMTIKHSVTNEYLNTCTDCLDGLDIPWAGNWGMLAVADEQASVADVQRPTDGGIDDFDDVGYNNY